MDEQGRIAPGDIVIRKADWRKGRKGPLGTVVSVIMPKVYSRAFHGPKARVKWATHQSGGTRIGGADITSLLYCDTLQVMEVVAGEGKMNDQGQVAGTCDTCGRQRVVTNVGTADYPAWECGTCRSRHERHINTHEMYGHGRPGY